MPTLILDIINEGLKFIDAKQATAIQIRVLNLRSDWDAELAKGDKRDDAHLDMLTDELLQLGQLFLTSIKSASPTNQS